MKKIDLSVKMKGKALAAARLNRHSMVQVKLGGVKVRPAVQGQKA